MIFQKERQENSWSYTIRKIFRIINPEFYYSFFVAVMSWSVNLLSIIFTKGLLAFLLIGFPWLSTIACFPFDILLWLSIVLADGCFEVFDMRLLCSNDFCDWVLWFASLYFRKKLRKETQISDLQSEDEFLQLQIFFYNCWLDELYQL